MTVKKKVPEPKALENRPTLRKVLDLLRTNEAGNRWNPDRTLRFFTSPTEELVIASVYLDEEGHICVDLEDVLEADEVETEAEEKERATRIAAEAPLQVAVPKS